MSYAIIRNEKLTRKRAIGAYNHNERKTQNHSNKNIDITKTDLNYYLKKNELSYIKEFDIIKEKYDLRGQIKITSNIMCEMIFTSEQSFFDNIGYEKTKRYFDESYKFICNYKNLGKQNIISAVVHLDEDTPHMHLLFIPVVHIKDNEGNLIDKLSCRDFWKGKNSYRTLQDAYFKHISSKGFDLERGQAVEVTKRSHLSIEEYKSITNYDETKKLVQNIKLGLPEVPDIKDFKKIMIGRDEKILTEIIKPKDNIIKDLYQDKILLQKQLSKQSNLIDTAQKYEKERLQILEENRNLNSKCLNLEEAYKIKNRDLDKFIYNKTEELEKDFEIKYYKLENKYHKIINTLEKENRFLKNTIETFKTTFKKFVNWICNKFSFSSENQLIKDFEKENYIHFNPDKELDLNRFKSKETELEL